MNGPDDVENSKNSLKILSYRYNFFQTILVLCPKVHMQSRCNTFLRIKCGKFFKTHPSIASNLGNVKHELLKNGAIITSFKTHASYIVSCFVQY